MNAPVEAQDRAEGGHIWGFRTLEPRSHGISWCTTSRPARRWSYGGGDSPQRPRREVLLRPPWVSSSRRLTRSLTLQPSSHVESDARDVFSLHKRLATERYHLLANTAGSNSTPVNRVDLAGPIGETIRLKCVNINKKRAADGGPSKHDARGGFVLPSPPANLIMSVFIYSYWPRQQRLTLPVWDECRKTAISSSLIPARLYRGGDILHSVVVRH